MKNTIIAVIATAVLTGSSFATSFESQKNESGLKFNEMQIGRSAADAPQAQAEFEPSAKTTTLRSPNNTVQNAISPQVPVPGTEKEDDARKPGDFLAQTAAGLTGSAAGGFLGLQAGCLGGFWAAYNTVSVPVMLFPVAGLVIGATVGAGLAVWGACKLLNK